MTFVVTSNCKDCRFTDCVEVCPVDCFHADHTMLYIDPLECIDCGACVPECPVDAIYPDDLLPEDERAWLSINRERAAQLPVINTKQEPLSGARTRAWQLGFLRR